MLAIVAMLGLGGCGSDISTVHDAEFTFEQTFGSKPSPAISKLQGGCSAFRDSGHCYLRFQCPRKEFNRLRPASFTDMTKGAFSTEITNAGITGPIPLWWTPLSGTSNEFWSSSAFHPTFFRGDALASYNDATQTAHFYWDGWD